MEIQKDDTQQQQTSSASHVDDSNSPVFSNLNGQILEIGFLIGLLILVVTTFAIFYYALPTLSDSLLKAQKHTESSYSVTV